MMRERKEAMCSYGKQAAVLFLMVRLIKEAVSRGKAKRELELHYYYPRRLTLKVKLVRVALVCVCVASFALKKHPSREIRIDRQLRIELTEVNAPAMLQPGSSRSSCLHRAKIRDIAETLFLCHHSLVARRN